MKFYHYFIFMLAMLMAGFIQGQDSQEQNVPIVSKAVYFDVTPPLRDMPIVLPGERDRSWKDNIIQNKSMEDEYKNMEANIPEDFVDPVLQQSYPASREIAGPVLNFEGVGNLCSCAPPDTEGDVGPDHYFQMINLAFAIWDKQGNLLYGPVDNSTLWDGFIGPWTGTNDGDPVVLYDELADRWIASQFAVNTSNGTYWQLVAVSSTSDPLGSYNRYAFQMPAFNDYPKLSVWPDAYYATFNMFGSYTRVGVAAFERDSMLAGSPDAQMVYFNQPSGTFSMLPADFDGTPPPVGSPCYFAHLRTFSSQNFEVYEFDVNWDSPSGSAFTMVSDLTTASFNPNLNGVPQPGTGTRLDDLGMMIMFRLQYRNFGTYQTLVANHTVNAGAGRTGVRWYELRKETGDWYIYQQGTYAPDDGEYRWMGSIAMNGNGDIGLGFSISSASTYPSIRYVGRRADATPGEMNLEEIQIIGGTSSQSGMDRWGDYSCLSVDPTDDSTFWFTNEYYKSGWKTRIASFNFGPILPPEVDAGNDTIICETEPFQADAQSFYQQSVQWYSSGDGFFVDPSKIQAVYLRGQGDVVNGGMTLWMVGTGYLPGQEDSDTVNVSLAKIAKANAGPDSTICADETIMLSGSAEYQDSILWKSDGDGTFDDVKIFNPLYTPGTEDISKGFVWLRLTAYDSLPCESSHTDKVKITIDQCTGIREGTESQFSIKVVPNPAYSQLNFQIRGIEKNQETMLTMTNTQGIVVFTMKLPITDGQYSNSMNISRFPKGIYYLKVSNMKEQVTQKVVLQ
ncbi:MAG: T9SS type A sorting domain-containing protein [Bacteroidales bacterium]|nr:T9SS type A sorting domain-containing protein [Bacteroidales bacterium]